jgi:hypothetical protein
MAAMADIPSNSWSAGLYYERKRRESEDRENRSPHKPATAEIETEYRVIPSTPSKG